MTTYTPHLNQAAPPCAGTARSPSSSASCSRSSASRCCSQASASAGRWPPSAKHARSLCTSLPEGLFRAALLQI